MRWVWQAASAAVVFAGGMGAAAAQACVDSSECGSFQVCDEGECVEVVPGEQPCETDEECGAGFCLDGTCWQADEPVPEDCDPDGGDCASDDGCFDGECDDVGRERCAADADCGDGMVCMGCACQPAEGTCASDDDCGAAERCAVPDVAVARDEGGADECRFDRGWCVLDPEKVEADPRCVAFCDALGECPDEPVEGGGSSSGSSGGGSAHGEATEPVDTDAAPLSEDERAECVAYCSYLLQDDEAGPAVADLVACVEAHADDACVAIGERCGDEAEAVAEASGDVAVAVGGSDEDQAGGGERPSAGDGFRRFFGGGDGAEGGGGGDGAEGGGNAAGDGGDDDGGCAAVPTAPGGAASLLVVGLLGLLNARRRRP